MPAAGMNGHGPDGSAPRSPLPRSVIVYYSLPHLVHAVVTLPMALFVPSYYADELALPLAAVGTAMAASRLLDVVVDLLIGVASDRLRTRWGRRKPWIALGTPVLMLATWMVFVPPPAVSPIYLLVWSGLLFLGFTLVDLPHKAWGAELSTDYTERTHVAGWREGFGALGQIGFLVLLLGLDWTGHGDARSQLMAIGLTIVVTLPILVAVSLAKTPEFPPDDWSEGPRGLAALRLIIANRAFIRTVGTLLLFGSAVLIQATLHRIVLTHVVGRADLFTPMILAENIASLAAIPIWIGLSHRIGKHRAITLASLWVGLWSLGLPWIGQGDVVPYIALIVLRGSSLASIFLLANAIAADVVDHDLLVSGRQRTGLFFAVWAVAIKLAVALGVLLATALPAAFGFEPSAPSNTPEAKQWLMTLYGWLPCVIMALGAPLMWNFPIDRNRQRALRDEIDTRRRPTPG